MDGQTCASPQGRLCLRPSTLLLDVFELVGPNPRPYAEVLEVWRTSCTRPRLREDTNDRGFIAHHHAPGRDPLVSVSATGTPA